MAQIFGSHSQRDEEYISFFSKAFLGTNVRGCFKEFENLVSGNVTAERVARDIEQSNANRLQSHEHPPSQVGNPKGHGREDDKFKPDCQFCFCSSSDHLA